jgi:hypothetical protein
MAEEDAEGGVHEITAELAPMLATVMPGAVGGPTQTESPLTVWQVPEQVPGEQVAKRSQARPV